MDDDGPQLGGDQPFTTLLPPGPYTRPATQVASYSATFNGTDTPTGNNTSYWFEYGNDTNYGNITFPTSLPTSTNSASLSYSINPIYPLTLYHFQLVVVDDSGTNYGGDRYFTTPDDPVPTVTTYPANSITASTATLQGTVAPHGLIANAYFQYGLDTNYGTYSSPFFASGNGVDTYFLTVTNLQPNTTYHYRFIASNRSYGANGADTNFTTAPLGPPALVSPGSGTAPGPTLGTLTPVFTWNAAGGAVAYGLYLSQYPSGTLVFSSTTLIGTSVQPVTLQPGTDYQWFMTSFDSLGNQSGASGSYYFVTPAPPAVQTAAPANLTTNSALLQASVTPNGLNTTCYFEYGGNANTDTNYASMTSTNYVGNGSAPQNVGATAANLAAKGNPYHFRVVAQNSLGTTYGADLQFTVP
ncbi:MAG TPA: hypothetical protein VN281_02330 [Verrucomicrobiae bacterium]|nr:hypothetical protein [Verrucomicrobiae bacterium]